MFKVGDKVVCIDNILSQFHIGGDKELTLCKTYIVLQDGARIVNDLGNEIFYSPTRFVSLQQYRKMKLQKIIK